MQNTLVRISLLQYTRCNGASTAPFLCLFFREYGTIAIMTDCVGEP